MNSQGILEQIEFDSDTQLPIYQFSVNGRPIYKLTPTIGNNKDGKLVVTHLRDIIDPELERLAKNKNTQRQYCRLFQELVYGHNPEKDWAWLYKDKEGK